MSGQVTSSEDLEARHRGDTQGGTRGARLLVIGHSHTNALSATLNQAPNPAFRVIHLNRSEDRSLLEAADPLASFRGDFEPSHVVSMIGGNTYHKIALLEHDTKIQVFEGPEDTDYDPDRYLVHHGVMREILESYAGLHTWMLERLKEKVALPIIHLLSPPPLGLEDISGFLPPAYQSLGSQSAVPPAQRLRFYRMHCGILRDHCQGLGIRVLEPPAAAVDSAGFLKDAYVAETATHANHRYGGLVLQQLLEVTGG